MDFDLSSDERDLQAGIRELCEKRFPMQHLRDQAGSIDRGDWDALWEAGVFSINTPEEDGGLGLGMTEAVLIFEELGRALVTGPLVGTLQGAKPGGIVGVVERGSSLVEYLDSLDTLAIMDDEGIWAVKGLVSIDAERVDRPLDPLTPLHVVHGLPQGVLVADPEAAAWRRLEGAGLTAALQLGIAARTTELAVAYAKERVQFGRAVGGFQAVKHLCADMLVGTEVARAAVYAAGVTLDDPSVGDPRRAVAAAKLLADEAAFRNGKTCIQVHGGMGFTWEVDAHLYLKRAAVLATQFGAADDHTEAVAACL